MRTMRLNWMRALGLACFVAAPAWAANAWTINTSTSNGKAVMNVISTVSWTVANSASSTNRINLITLQIPQTPYDINGAIAPLGWTVSTIDKLNRKVTFTANGACPSGLAPGASAVFSASIIGAAASSDTTDTFVL